MKFWTFVHVKIFLSMGQKYTSYQSEEDALHADSQVKPFFEQRNSAQLRIAYRWRLDVCSQKNGRTTDS